MSAKATGPKVVVVGTGGGGCRIHIPALRSAGFDVVGLVGRNPETTKERAKLSEVPAHFTDLDAAIKQTGAGAVSIATPPHAHAPGVLTAIKHGCHVLCEKPFARDATEAQAMLDAATKAGIVHMLGNEFRWQPPRALAQAVIARGEIGEPRFLAFTSFSNYITSPTTDLPEWWLDPESGGGWLGAQGAHMVDCVRYWLGDFESLNATRQWVGVPKDGAEDSYVIRFRLVSGLEGVIQQTAGTWGPYVSVMRVAGTKGTLWIDGGALWIADAGGMRQAPVTSEYELPPLPDFGADPRHQTAEWKLLAAAELPGFQRLCEAWRAAIEGRDAPGPVRPATFADGAANMRVIDAVRTSMASGGALVTLRNE